MAAYVGAGFAVAVDTGRLREENGMGYLREACIEAAGKAMPGWLTWEDVVGVVDAVLSVVADECDHAAAEVYYDDPKDTLEELIANDFARYSISRLASELRETP